MSVFGSRKKKKQNKTIQTHLRRAGLACVCVCACERERERERVTRSGRRRMVKRKNSVKKPLVLRNYFSDTPCLVG